MSNVVLDKFLKGLKAVQGQKAPERADEKAQERLRIRNQLLTLHNKIKVDFPELDVRPLELLIRQGVSIVRVDKVSDFFSIDIERSDGTTGQVIQQLGARRGETYVHSNSRNGEDATIHVETDGRRAKFVKRGENSEETYNRRGVILSRTTDEARDEFESGRLVSSVDLGTGNRSYYYDGTDRVAFVENPAGQVVVAFEFDVNKKFEVQLQPTKFLVVQNNKKLMAKPRLRLRRLRAYKKKIRAHVKQPRVSGEFDDSSKVDKLKRTRQVIMVAGVVSVANPKAMGPLQGMFGLSEGLVATFLRSGSAYGDSVGKVFAKPTVVANTTKAARTSDDVVSVRSDTLVPMIVMSEGAFLVMSGALTDPSERAHDERSEPRDGAKPAIKIKGAMLHASYKPEAPIVGAPVMAGRGATPVAFRARYVPPKRVARVFNFGTSDSTSQANLFRGSVLTATSADQYAIVSRALPVVMKAAAPVEPNISIKDAMREMFVKKPSRGSRDSGSGSNPHHGNDDQPKKQQPKQADS